MLSLVESVLENPRVVLMAQLDRVKDQLMAAMKAEGVEYDERMERLAEVTWPQPNAEELLGRRSECSPSTIPGWATTGPAQVDRPGHVRDGHDLS